MAGHSLEVKCTEDCLKKNNPIILRGWAVHFTNMVGNKLYSEEIWYIHM